MDYVHVHFRLDGGLTGSGSLSGLLVFGHPLATIAVIYVGYLLTWLPISFILSAVTILLAIKYNRYR